MPNRKFEHEGMQAMAEEDSAKTAAKLKKPLKAKLPVSGPIGKCWWKYEGRMKQPDPVLLLGFVGQDSAVITVGPEYKLRVVKAKELYFIHE